MSQFDYSQYTNQASMEASHAIKDGAGGRGVFLADKIKDLPHFQPQSPQTGGRIYVMDIIMYKAGANHPLVAAGKIQPGHPVHIAWVYVHKGLGPNRDWRICMARTYGQRCPACEKRNLILANTAHTREQAWELAKPYGTGTYPIGIYNVIVHQNPQQITWQEPVMYWEINNAFMESKLQSAAKDPMSGAFVNYAWPTAGKEGGRHISFEVYKKGQYDDYKGHAFYERQSQVPEHVMANAICLDDLLDLPTYEDIKDLVESMEGQPVGGQPTGETATSGGIGMGGLPCGVPDMAAPGLPAPILPPETPPPLFGAPTDQCPYASYGGVLGRSFGTWEECQACTLKIQCEPKSVAAAPVAGPIPAATPQAGPSLAPGPTAPMPRRPR